MTDYNFFAHGYKDVDIAGREEKERSATEECRYHRSDGTLLGVEVDETLVSYRGKEVACSVARSITGRKQSEWLLAEAQRIAGLGIWEWDVANGRVFWYEEQCRR